MIDRLWGPSIKLRNNHLPSRFRTVNMSEKEEDRCFKLECIDVYKQLPTLWKVKSYDYSNRKKEDAVYAVLIENLREIPQLHKG